MKISIVTLFPSLYHPFLETSLIDRAHKQGIVDTSLISLLEFVSEKKRIDSPTFGPGAGMLLRPEVIEAAIEKTEAERGPAYKIFFSPQGKKLDQELLRCLMLAVAQKKHMLLVPARYEGMDVRVEHYYADSLLSIGDFVLMGGDLPAMVLIESMLRLMPGVIGKQESVEKESFSGAFLDYPEYTNPVEWKGEVVPAIIRSGNHEKIQEWRQAKAAENTVIHHFDWLRSHVVQPEDKALATEYIPAHYAVLMHDHVKLPDGTEGTSSVTSLDIHDIARSAKTFGIKKYFIITPLEDQKKIIAKLLSFWQADVGIEYNVHRHEALANVQVVDSLEEAIDEIEKIEQSKPILVATGAQVNQQLPLISYYDQEKIWVQKRPVAIIFGTARGLGDSVLKKSDYLLAPVEGFSSFNHLSVRSAAAIIFDRWLGINRKITHCR